MLVRNSPELQRLACPIAQFAKQQPYKTALVCENHTLSYLKLHLAIEHLCKQLLVHLNTQNLKPSLGLGIQANNQLITVLSIWAAARLGLPLFLIPSSHSQVRKEAQLKKIHFLDDWLNADIIKACLDSTEPQHISEHTLQLHKPFTWLQSSGSTAEPKWICHTLNNHKTSAQALQSHCPLNSNSTWACVLPLHHISGLAVVFRCGFSGACLLLSKHYKDTWWLDKEVTHISLVETQLDYLFPKNNVPALNISKLKTVLLGGGPLIDTKISQHLAAYAKPSQPGAPYLSILKSYGLTETASQICVSKWPNPTNGFSHTHTQLKCSKTGVIYIKGPSLSCGYLNVQGQCVPITCKNGWFKSNDLGKKTADGWIITGRADNMFICGGENIQPEYIEAFFLNHTLTSACLCIPLAHAHYGHCPVLFIQSTLSLQQLQKRAETLEPFQRPQHYFLMPKNLSQNPKHWRKELISSLKTRPLSYFSVLK